MSNKRTLVHPRFCTHWSNARELKAKTKEALATRDRNQLYLPQLSIELKIEFFHSGEAEFAALVPGAMYSEGGTEVTFIAKDAFDLYRAMDTITAMASKTIFF